jgi:hypothetical protein
MWLMQKRLGVFRNLLSAILGDQHQLITILLVLGLLLLSDSLSVYCIIKPVYLDILPRQ